MDVLVIGAGVAGLTTAISLAEAGLSVTIRTEALPGQTTSAAAGAVWGVVKAGPPDRALEWGRAGLEVLAKLAAEPGTGVRMAVGREVSRAPLEPHFWTHLLTDLRACEESELPDGFRDGWHYTTPLATMPVYLDYLRARFERAGGTLEVAPVTSLTGLAGTAPVIVNCSGAAARDLVPDPAVIPVRGQVVIAANPGIEEFLINRDPEPPWIVYMFPHGDEILLGARTTRNSTPNRGRGSQADRSPVHRHRAAPARGGDPRPPRRPAAVAARGAAGVRAALGRRAVAQLRSRRRGRLAVLGLRRRDRQVGAVLARGDDPPEPPLRG
jgi:D-amino-acid oxidase